MACPSAPTGEVCLQASACSHGADGQPRWQRSSMVEERVVGGQRVGVDGGGGGSALALNLVPVQKAWGRVAASQAATARRQDIPAQDEETSVTTCYANPRSWTRERSEGGEGGR